MRRVASMPFMLGIAMSMMTTSGLCSSARRTLSRPSAASATTAMSGCFSSSARRPSRTTVWSSASSMRMGIVFVVSRWGAFSATGSSARMEVPRPGCESMARRPPRRRTRSSMPSRPRPRTTRGSKPSPSSRTLKRTRPASRAQLHFDIVRIRMAGGIVDRLLYQAVDAGLVLVGEVVCPLVGSENDVESGALAGLARVPVEGGDESEIVEHGRTEEQGEVADFVDGFLGQAAYGVQVIARFPDVDRASGALGLHQDGGERLAHFVVQFAGEGAALVLLRPEELGRQLLQVGPGAEVLFESALQLALEAQRVADGQEGQEDAAAEGDGEGGDERSAEVFGGGGDLVARPDRERGYWRGRCGPRSGAWRCGAG